MSVIKKLSLKLVLLFSLFVIPEISFAKEEIEKDYQRQELKKLLERGRKITAQQRLNRELLKEQRREEIEAKQKEREKNLALREASIQAREQERFDIKERNIERVVEQQPDGVRWNF